MKVLLLGHKGYLGSFLLKSLSKYNVDIETNRIDYDYVINCISKSNVEYCEQYPDISYESNVQVVSDICQKFSKSKIIHFSSYYVYDDEGYCNESSKTTDKYVYMKHKLESEKIVLFHNGLCFRLGKLFGNPDVGKQNKLTEYIIKNDNLVLDAVRFNPTSVKQVSDIIKTELKTSSFVGLYNLSNLGTSSSLEYGNYINECLGTHKHITAIDKTERIFNNYGRFLMSVKKLQPHIQLRDWKHDMKEYLRKINV